MLEGAKVLIARPLVNIYINDRVREIEKGEASFSAIGDHRLASLVLGRLHVRRGEVDKKIEGEMTISQRVKHLGQEYLRLNDRFARYLWSLAGLKIEDKESTPLPRETINRLWNLYITSSFPDKMERDMREDGLFRRPV